MSLNTKKTTSGIPTEISKNLKVNKAVLKVDKKMLIGKDIKSKDRKLNKILKKFF